MTMTVQSLRTTLSQPHEVQQIVDAIRNTKCHSPNNRTCAPQRVRCTADSGDVYPTSDGSISGSKRAKDGSTTAGGDGNGGGTAAKATGAANGNSTTTQPEQSSIWPLVLGTLTSLGLTAVAIYNEEKFGVLGTIAKYVCATLSLFGFVKVAADGLTSSDTRSNTLAGLN